MTVREIMQHRWGVPLHEIDILLAHTLRQDKVFLYSHPEYKLTAVEWRQVQRSIKRRRAGEPIAYITGHKEFFGLDFIVNRHVLIPRPDTEVLVEKTIQYLRAKTWRQPPLLVDIGTGSGNIAVTLAQLYPTAKVVMTDISKTALRVAQANAKQQHVRIKSYAGNVLQALPQRYQHTIDVLVCNAPYLSKTEARKKTLAYEPAVALTPKRGSPTSIIEALLHQAPLYLKPGGVIFLEIGYRQAKQVSQLCQSAFPHSGVIIYQDLGKFDRVVACQTAK